MPILDRGEDLGPRPKESSRSHLPFPTAALTVGLGVLLREKVGDARFAAPLRAHHEHLGSDAVHAGRRVADGCNKRVFQRPRKSRPIESNGPAEATPQFHRVTEGGGRVQRPPSVHVGKAPPILDRMPPGFEEISTEIDQ